MDKEEAFYKEIIRDSAIKLEALKKRIHLIGSFRLLVVLMAAFSLWLFREESWSLRLLVLLGCAVVFILLMIYHNRLFARKEYHDKLQKCCMDELTALNYDFSSFADGSEFIDRDHAFSLDLDLFGPRSLFQSLNRTVTARGRQILASWLRNPMLEKRLIENRQKAVLELSHKIRLCLHFRVKGTIAASEMSDCSAGLGLLAKESRPIRSSLVQKILMTAVPIVWALLIFATAMNWIGETWLTIWFVVSLFLANMKAKEIARLCNHVNHAEQLFQSYAGLMQLLEKQDFETEELKAISTTLKDDREYASVAIGRLSKIINALDQRFSLAGLILNLLYLRDVRHAVKLGQWAEDHVAAADRWMEALSQFDALVSLGGFAFNHPDYIYPTITEHYFCLQGEELGHPLMKRGNCVTNPVDIPCSPRFIIITGANMAGKSTYLRTVGVNYLLALCGLPVFAKQLTVSPASMVTSLRTTDSLVGNESYFFAELKRLKMIIDHLKSGEKLFIILDEILKGTNSVDRQKGSIALIRQLIALGGCGIVATHDLSIGSLADENPEAVVNGCFESEIKEGELSFAYKLGDGIARNMNACFLMKKMGIVME
jgi:Ca2+/Na+ antiporter